MRPKGPPVGAALNQKSLQVQTGGCGGPSPSLRARPARLPAQHTLPDWAGQGPACRTGRGWAGGWVRGQSSGLLPASGSSPSSPPARRPEAPLSSLPPGPGSELRPAPQPQPHGQPRPAVLPAAQRILRLRPPGQLWAARAGRGSRWRGRGQRRGRAPPGGPQGRRSPGLPSGGLRAHPPWARPPGGRRWPLRAAGRSAMLATGTVPPAAGPAAPARPSPGLTCTAPSPRPPAPRPTGRPRPPAGAGWCPGACREGGLRQRQEPLPQTRPQTPAGLGTQAPQSGPASPRGLPAPRAGAAAPVSPWDSPLGASPTPSCPPHAHPPGRAGPGKRSGVGRGRTWAVVAGAGGVDGCQRPLRPPG